MFEKKYEIRANWDEVMSQPEIATLAMFAKLTGNREMGAFLITLCISNFVYDLDANEFVDANEGARILSNMVSSGQGDQIFSALEDMMKEEQETQPLEMDDASLRSFFGLDKQD